MKKGKNNYIPLTAYSAAPDLLEIVKKVESVVDDLMGEAMGTGIVQDWGAVNDLLVNTARVLRKAEGRE